MILDNAPFHPPAEELRAIGNIFVMFMHPNVTALILYLILGSFYSFRIDHS